MPEKPLKALWQVLSLAKKYDFIYSAAGIHPEHDEETTDEDIAEIEKNSTSKQKGACHRRNRP